MKSEQVTSNDRSCPACGRQAGYERGRKNHFQLLSCRACATLYAATHPTVEQSEDYDAYYTAENLAIPPFIHRRLDEIVKTFDPYRKANRLLDVGCGAGSFLEAAARAGWQAFGVEISQTAAAHVSEQGFQVFCGELADANYPDEYFDVVIASEVLEHVFDPRSLLKDIARVLRPGGLLWATTPHGRGISARLLDLGWTAICPPEHLQLFSVKSIKAMLRNEGFKQIDVATHGVNPFEILHELYARISHRTASQNKSAPTETFDRVESSYQLNEFMSEGRSRRLLKRTINSLLAAGRLGDSLKVLAEK